MLQDTEGAGADLLVEQLDDLAELMKAAHAAYGRPFIRVWMEGGDLQVSIRARGADDQPVTCQGCCKRERLLRMWDVLLLALHGRSWIQVPMISELFDACSRHVPELEKKHERRRIEYTKAVLGSEDLAEVFVLAVDGLTKDLPSEAVPRRRVTILIDRFII